MMNWNRWVRGSFRIAIARPILRVYRDVIEYSGAAPLVFVLLFMAAQVHAGEIEPRAYANTPVGVNFLLAGYTYSDGGLSTSGSSPLKDAQLKIHTEILAYARSLDVSGKSGKFDVILPFTEGLQFIDLAAQCGLFCSRKYSFRTRPAKPIERWLLEFSYRELPIEQGEVVLYKKGLEWSESYVTLTRDYYLKL